ncbi:hypothetical protein F5Y06DRAFT_299532 [Hypoxylon sp. FL0890]|nr:hypothetical protein F5Y06DRAFT_299532 [Hypoxylon sp. FL0890]
MEDVPSRSPLDPHNDRYPSPSTNLPVTNVVHVPIHRSRHDFLRQFVPYDDPVVFDVRPAQWHRHQKSVFLFRYTDFRGWPAVQPAANEEVIKAYLGPLAREDERSGACDKLLLEARWWSCWAQGFTYLEPELRWVLTLVFDLVGVIIAKQKAAAARVSGTMRRGDVDMGANMEPDDMTLLFWEGRYYLHNLMGVIMDMKEQFGIDNLKLPRLLWFDEN